MKFNKIVLCVFFIITVIKTTQAATFSSTKIELLYGQDFLRGVDGAEIDEATFTIANATGFTWGDSFFFADVNGINDTEDTGGIHMEFSTRYRFWEAKQSYIIKSAYGIIQADITSNTFVEKLVPMIGASIDWEIPGFNFFKSHLQYRDDPKKKGSSVQFTLVWNLAFILAEQNFSFEGFADWTQGEGEGVGSESNLLMQPQLLWMINKNIALGIEYQYWKNRLGIEGLNEKVPQIMARWTF